MCQNCPDKTIRPEIRMRGILSQLDALMTSQARRSGDSNLHL